MAQVIFIDGFDHRARVTDGAKGWQGAALNLNATFSRNVNPVGKGCQLFYTTADSNNISYVFPIAFVQQWATAGVACYNDQDSPIQFWIRFWENHAANVAFDVYPLADGSVQASTPGGTITSTVNRVAYIRTWQYWEVSAKMNTFVLNGTTWTPVRDGQLIVKIDGNIVLSATGLILSSRDHVDGNLNPGWSGIGLRSFSARVDDFYVSVGADAVLAPAFQGNIRIYPLVPVADSTPLQYTPSVGGAHWTLLTDLDGNSDMLPYVQVVTVGNQDMYLVGASIIPDGLTIIGVQTSLLAQKTDSNNAGIKMRISSNAIERFSPSSAVPQVLPQFFYEYVQKDPNGTIAWTKAALAAAKFGSELQAS